MHHRAESARVLKVAAIQMECENGNVQGNLRRADGLIEQAAMQGAKLVLLPELTPNGFQMTEALWEGAEPFDGPIVQWLRHNSKRLGIHLGMTFLEADGEDFFNTFALSTPEGRIAGRVRKSPPASFEAYFYRGGNDNHVIETELGRIGVGICYEKALYERLSTLQDSSVDLLLQPTSAPSPMASFPLRQKDVDDFNRLVSETPCYYAKTLGVPVVMANKCGPFATQLPAFFPAQRSVFPGLSAVVDGDGIIKGQLGAAEGVVVATVHLAPNRKVTRRPDPVGRWAMPQPWFAFIWEWTQRMGERAYAKNPRRRARARAISNRVATSPNESCEYFLE